MLMVWSFKQYLVICLNSATLGPRDPTPSIQRC